jgi:hypothetical protein
VICPPSVTGRFRRRICRAVSPKDLGSALIWFLACAQQVAAYFGSWCFWYLVTWFVGSIFICGVQACGSLQMLKVSPDAITKCPPVEIPKDIFIFHSPAYIQNLPGCNILNRIAVQDVYETSCIAGGDYVRSGIRPKGIFIHRNIGEGRHGWKSISFDCICRGMPHIAKIYYDELGGRIGWIGLNIAPGIKHPRAFIHQIFGVHFLQLTFSSIRLPFIFHHLFIEQTTSDYPDNEREAHNKQVAPLSHFLSYFLPINAGILLFFGGFGLTYWGVQVNRKLKIPAFLLCFYVCLCGIGLMIYGFSILIP